jgi:hypothetical protein
VITHWKYLRYVLRHKWYVFQACLAYGLVWAGIVHDLSKFRPREWLPYAEFFYGIKHPGAKERFDMAWNHHQKSNPHHWQYWVLQEDGGAVKILDMPMRYRQEMIADWRGAGRAITGKDGTANWYLRNKEKMQIHPLTRQWIERELGL